MAASLFLVFLILPWSLASGPPHKRVEREEGGEDLLEENEEEEEDENEEKETREEHEGEQEVKGCGWEDTQVRRLRLVTA